MAAQCDRRAWGGQIEKTHQDAGRRAIRLRLVSVRGTRPGSALRSPRACAEAAETATEGALPSRKLPESRLPRRQEVSEPRDLKGIDKGVPFPYFHISPLRARKAWDPQGLQRVGNGCGGHLVEGSWDRPWDIASSSMATRGSRWAWDGGSHSPDAEPRGTAPTPGLRAT